MIEKLIRKLLFLVAEGDWEKFHNFIADPVNAVSKEDIEEHVELFMFSPTIPLEERQKACDYYREQGFLPELVGVFESQFASFSGGGKSGNIRSSNEVKI